MTFVYQTEEWWQGGGPPGRNTHSTQPWVEALAKGAGGIRSQGIARGGLGGPGRHTQFVGKRGNQRSLEDTSGLGKMLLS